MGLILGILFGIVTIAGSILLLFSEASMDTRGDQTPWLTIVFFLGGVAISGLCIVTHFHPIGW